MTQASTNPTSVDSSIDNISYRYFSSNRSIRVLNPLHTNTRTYSCHDRNISILSGKVLPRPILERQSAPHVRPLRFIRLSSPPSHGHVKKARLIRLQPKIYNTTLNPSGHHISPRENLTTIHITGTLHIQDYPLVSPLFVISTHQLFNHQNFNNHAALHDAATQSTTFA